MVDIQNSVQFKPKILRLTEHEKIMKNASKLFSLIKKKTNSLTKHEIPKPLSIKDIPEFYIAVRERPLLEREKTKVDNDNENNKSKQEIGIFNELYQPFKSVIINNSNVYVCKPHFRYDDSTSIKISTFNVDVAFSENDTNETIFQVCCQHLIKCVFDEGCSTLIAYGQTGSGKTYTLSSMQFLVANEIINIIQKENKNIKLYLACFEILGQKIFDLLNQRANVDLNEDVFGEVQLTNLMEVTIDSVEQVNNLLEKAISYRKTRATFKNDTSSRSHFICKFKIRDLDNPAAEDGIFHIVDLAGSETAKDSLNHSKERMEETKQINTSLMQLKECIRSRTLFLQDTSKSVHIPYRNSKLTLLLKDAFEVESRKQCKTVIIGNISPGAFDTAQSINTLNYVSQLKAKDILPVRIKKNTENPSTWDNKFLKAFYLDILKEKNYQDNAIDLDKLLPYETGLQVSRLSRKEFYDKVISVGGSSDIADLLYEELWQKIIDVRTANRRRNFISKNKNKNEESKEVKIDDFIRIKTQNDDEKWNNVKNKFSKVISVDSQTGLLTVQRVNEEIINYMGQKMPAYKIDNYETFEISPDDVVGKIDLGTFANSGYYVLISDVL